MLDYETSQNVSDLPECQALQSKLGTWTKPLEGQWEYTGEVGWCPDWGITPVYHPSKSQWRCGEKQNNESQSSTINWMAKLVLNCSNQPLNCVKSLEFSSPGYTVWVTPDGYWTD